MDSDLIYSLLRKIPPGRVTTYKLIADYFGSQGYQAVGQIVGANTDIPNTPCHRVVTSSGTLGGYALGQERKRALLSSEGIKFEGERIIGFDKIIWIPIK